MTIVNNYGDYLARRTAGEKVTTTACALASQIDCSGITDFAILQLDEDRLLFTGFSVKDDRYHITKQQEETSKALHEALPIRYLNDKKTLEWWKTVFLEKNGRHTYDAFYDELTISDLLAEEDAEPSQFGELLPKVATVVKSWTFLQGVNKLYLTGIFASTLLMYVIEQAFENVQIVQIDIDRTAAAQGINDTPKVVLPNGLSQHQILIGGGLPLTALAVTDPLRISLPIDDMNLQGNLISDYPLTWENVMKPDSIVADYTIVNSRFKELHLHVECDAYGNTFLVTDDFADHHIVTPLNI